MVSLIISKLKHKRIYSVQELNTFDLKIANSLLPPHRRHAPTTRIGQTLNKLMGGHLLDRRIDGIDFLPFLTVLVAAGLLTAGLFGDDFTDLNLFGDFGGLNDGNLILKAKTENPNTPRRFSRAIQGSNIR